MKDNINQELIRQVICLSDFFFTINMKFWTVFFVKISIILLMRNVEY